MNNTRFPQHLSDSLKLLSMVVIWVHGGARSLGMINFPSGIQVICQNRYKMWFRFLVLYRYCNLDRGSDLKHGLQNH